MLALVVLSALTSACPSKDRPEDRRGPPPPPPSAQAPARACAAGGGSVADPALATAFPKTSSGYCVDPNGETRSFGEGAKKPLDAVCTEAFDGECEVYKSFGLRMVTTFRYVDGGGTPGSVDVVVSRFATREGAYGMFTKRVVGDGDPAQDRAPRDLGVAGASALGTGSAYLWKGQLFVELTYANETETPQQFAVSSGRLLEALAKEVAPKLPGAPELPPSAAALPAANRVPLGILFEPKDAFGVSGGGAGAYGFYKQGDKRWRVLAIARDDAEQAKDVLGSLARRKGASKEKEAGEGGVRLAVGEGSEGPKAEWIAARAGRNVFGVGDETLSLRNDMGAADRDKVSLTRSEKAARLKALLQPAN
jgi:hypothetical protein